MLRPLCHSGVGEGTRTLDTRNHNPMLYQLNYAHHMKLIRDAPGRCRLTVFGARRLKWYARRDSNPRPTA